MVLARHGHPVAIPFRHVDLGAIEIQRNAMSPEADIQTIKDLQIQRLASQFEGLKRILEGFDEAEFGHPPAGGKWSAKQQLAHLARYHEIFQERLRRILEEDSPRFARYRAEEDAEWINWQTLCCAAITAKLQGLRTELNEKLQKLPADSYRRVGVHPTLGSMTLADWLDFFLVHEGHHMYMIFSSLRNLPR